MTAQEAVAANPAWYHTIELAPGVVTPGQIDHRGVAGRVLPRDLSGKRALDVGTFDGFWAFEMERRGAEVVAIDVDWDWQFDWPAVRRPKSFPEEPRGRTFELAKEAFDSKVERRAISVYEATPD